MALSAVIMQNIVFREMNQYCLVEFHQPFCKTTTNFYYTSRPHVPEDNILHGLSMFKTTALRKISRYNIEDETEKMKCIISSSIICRIRLTFLG